MGNWHLLTPDWTSGATASSNSDASSTTTAVNLLKVQQSVKWRSAVLTSLQVTLDAGSAVAWDTLALLYHNGTSSGTIRVTSNASTGTLFSSPSYDSTALGLTFSGDLSSFAENHSWLAVGSTQTYRYIGIEINDATNPDGYFEAGVVMAGELWTPPMGPDLGASFGRNDPSEEVNLVNGETIKRPKRGRDVATWTFPKQSAAQVYGNWLPIHRLYGSKIPVVAKWDPLVANYEQHGLWYGYAQWRDNGPVTFVNGTNNGFYDVEMGIAEV